MDGDALAGFGEQKQKKRKKKKEKKEEPIKKWGVLRATKDKRRGTDGGFLVLGNGPRKSKPWKRKRKQMQTARKQKTRDSSTRYYEAGSKLAETQNPGPS